MSLFGDEEPLAPVGVVPVEGRGALPFTLLQGESLVALASWALAEAGVELLDFTETWDSVRSRETAWVLHDPLCPGTPVEFLAEAVRRSADLDAIVVGVRPVTDTVKELHGDVVGETVDRERLHALTSPLVLPARVVASLSSAPATDDLAVLVAALAADYDVDYLPAPAVGRRVADESEVAVVAALIDQAGQPGRD